MKTIEGMPGIKVGGQNFNNLRYADDTVLVAKSETELQALLDTVIKESEMRGLGLNTKKTEVIVISKGKEPPKCTVYAKGNKLRQAVCVKNLGTILTSDGRCLTEIKSRIAQAKTAFQRMRTILCNKSTSLKTRKRVLQCYIEPILLYGCEAWTLNKEAQRRVEAAEMWFLRRMLKIPWTARKSNEEVLKEAEEIRRLITLIRKRQSKFVGHVWRRCGMEHILTTGKIEGKRDRGRQREKMLDGLTRWQKNQSNVHTLQNARNRELWRQLISNACRHGP